MIHVAFHPEAEAELLAGARYYEEKARSLGLDFLTAVEASCERIQRFPTWGIDSGHGFGVFWCHGFHMASSIAPRTIASGS